MLKNAFLTLFFLLCASSASFGGLSVFPQRIEKCIPPGGKGTGVYIITSDYSEPITVSVEARHWFTLKENKGIKIDDWYSISKREFVVGPGERMSIPYEVVVPTSAVGTLVGMVSFIPRDPGMQGISLLISVSIYVTVDGTQRLSWGIEKLEIKEKRLDYDRDVYAHVTNDGNVHIRPTGTAKITKG
ncbi:MAG: hypothetical protein JW803_06510, partial [Endomicrobiales bacterium]|nr:hypothetical protein [Endomicrobiales bacterium]